MCTVTVNREPELLVVTMNRDELRSRAPEVPPQRVLCPGGRDWIGPRDGERGGTWMAVNGDGAVGCMTNGPIPLERIPDFSGPEVPSRGSILPALMPLGTQDRILEELEQRFDPIAYPPFKLVLAGPMGVFVYAWSFGGQKTIEPLAGDWVMLTSSLWHAEEVEQYRRDAFDEWLAQGALTVDKLPTFHLLYDPRHPDLSPRMEREISCTRSITQVRVQSGHAPELRYAPLAQHPGMDCERLPMTTYTL